MPARVHGRGYRRTVFTFQAVLAGVYLASQPWSGVSGGTFALRLLFLALIIGAGGFWLALRPSVAWDDEAITLTSALRIRRIPWRELAGSEWVRSGSMGLRLVVITTSGGRYRVPSVMRVTGTDWWARFWQSEPLDLTAAVAAHAPRAA